MKVKYLYFIFPIIIFIMMVPIFDCSDKGTNTSPDTVLYLSSKNNGCKKTNKTLKANADSILTYNYSAGNLNLNLLFRANCASKFKDSVLISGNEIKIYLADTSRVQVRCLCSMDEEFSFKTDPGKRIYVLCYCKSYIQTEYLLLVEKEIEI